MKMFNDGEMFKASIGKLFRLIWGNVQVYIWEISRPCPEKLTKDQIIDITKRTRHQVEVV